MPLDLPDPLVTAPLATPFGKNDRVDLDAAQRNAERYLDTGLAGFLIGSATGEEDFLSEEEKTDLLFAVGDVLDENRFLAGGVDCPSVTESLRRIEAFTRAGAEVVRVRPPRDPGSVERYYAELVPRCPVPVLVMHQPAPRAFGFAAPPAADAETLGRVASMDNVFGYVTDHDVRFEANVRRHITDDDRRFWICNGSLILHGTLIGANGTTTAFANIWPDALVELLRLGMAGRYDEAKPLQETVARLDAVMLKPGPIGVKIALGLMGFEGMRPRAGFEPRAPSVVDRIEEELRAAGLLAK
ncbi:MAG: dihydrodipicolinate synthase family protein [Planctomycetota bacterium]|jgi:dihydrodipicolinate synthase/N-acetylneuraminate lyase